jgi:hypothetical protein
MFRSLRLLLTAGLLIAIPGLSHSADVEAKGSVVLVNGKVVFDLKSEVNGLPPDVRAELIASTLSSIGDARDVEVKQSGADYVILLQGALVTTITKAEAAKYRVSAAVLAKQWANRLSQALAAPPLKFAVDQVAIPLADAKIIRIGGSRWKDATIQSTNDEVVIAERTAEGVRLRAKGLGQATIIAKAGTDADMLQVQVRPWASEPIPKVFKSEVTGSPASGSAVRGAVSYTLHTFVSSLPRATVSYQEPKAAALGSGATKSYTVRLRVSAPGAFDRVGESIVQVSNRPLGKMADKELWYCNNPEIVKKPQPLFAARLKQDNPARLLYHHLNGASIPMYLRIQAINESDQPARVRVLIGDAKPDSNPVVAGLDAGVKYLKSWMSGSGEILTIPAQSSIPITFRRLSPGETASGLSSLLLLDGPDDLLVRTDSWPPFELDARWREAEASNTPWREVGASALNVLDTASYDYSEQIFPQASKMERVDYQVGGRYGFVRIGQKPISRLDSGLSLDGNFGVLYNISASIGNPTPVATDVELVFEASAGYSGGLFIVNGTLQRTPLLQPKQEARIAKMHMLPGSQRSMSIMTMPLSGSSYPATITLRPVQHRTILESLLERTY